MGFDIENFGIGLAAGWASAYAVYRFRRQIQDAVTTTRQQASSAQNYATRSADGRYVNDLIEIAERSHLAGRFVRLTDILVEPRFLPAPELVAPVDDEVVHSVFHVVPQVPDHPYLHAVYNIETLSIDDLSTGSRALALLGVPGSGRTTALLSIALHSLGQLKFHSLDDVVQSRLDEEEAALTDKQRAQREKERRQIEQRAIEQLREQHGIQFHWDGDETGNAIGFNRYIPVYVHLGNVNISAEEFGPQIDPAEPLVRAVQSQVGPITARSLPLRLYRRLAQGQALLLVDGLDDLPIEEQEEKLIWLRALMNAYSDNFFIVAGTPYGYGGLAHMGLTPVFLRPWSDLNIRQSVEQWTHHWPVIGGTRRRPANRPDEQQTVRARTNNRALSPVDLSLKVWTTFADDAEATGYDGWLRSYLSRHLPAKQNLNDILPQLALIAAVQLDEGFITLEKLESMSSLDSLTTVDEDEAEMDAEDDKADGKGKKEDASNQGKFLNMLRRSGLVVSYRGSRYQFRHSHIAAYLASLTASSMSPETMAAKADHPAWQQALAYAAAHTSIESAVKARLGAAPDVLHNGALVVSRWLAYAGQQVSWRGPLLKHIGNMMIAPNQYPLVRERAAAALIGTRDRNTIYIFRQAARNPNPDVRRLACLGIGAIGSAEAINDLIPLLEDHVDDVQLAAALALGAIGNDEALEALVIALTEGSEQLRQAVAEAMAALPEDGYPILYDAISHEDMMVRRAATYGLRRLGARWTKDALYRAFLEDEQWYVRSAAQQAFHDLQEQEGRGPAGYPPVGEIPWLVNWAAENGENVPAGEAASQVLYNALAAGDAEIRLMAARAMGQLGEVNAAKSLYATLRDRQEGVRIAAHQSLADLEMQLGQPLPAPA